MTIKVCFVGDDAHPPWNHASSVLTKRMIECLAERNNIELSLVTAQGQVNWDHELESVEKMFAKTSGKQGLDAMRLSLTTRNTRPDILHLVGTNALIFSPVSKIIRRNSRILRHIFTPYDARDRMVGPIRQVANRFFIDSYAFTTPRIGQWSEEIPNSKRFILRPPLDTRYYKPGPSKMLGLDQHRDPVVLYMGPLMPTRFPMETILAGVKRLKEAGTRMRLVVLTSASRTSVAQCEKLLALGRNLSLSDDLIFRRVDLSENERIDWYNTADVVLFPYVGPEPEKLADPPFGILEAMSCGRVVLSTDVLSVSDVVKDGMNGYLMRNMTVEGLQEGLRRALDPSIKTSLQTRAREHIKNTFDYSIIAEQAIKTYSALLR